MLKKYKIVTFKNLEKVIFTRSRHNGKFICGYDCSLTWECKFKEGYEKLDNVCEILRGIRTRNINIYSYYPPTNDN